jgi:hypothetical protein
LEGEIKGLPAPGPHVAVEAWHIFVWHRKQRRPYAAFPNTALKSAAQNSLAAIKMSHDDNRISGATGKGQGQRQGRRPAGSEAGGAGAPCCSTDQGHTPPTQRRVANAALEALGRVGRGACACRKCERRSNRSAARYCHQSARIVRHKGAHGSRSAPLAKPHHLSRARRGGPRRPRCIRCSMPGRMERDRDAFAERCEDDRHHFRFIVSSGRCRQHA